MADRNALLILVKAEQDAVQVVADAQDSADKLVKDAQEKTIAIQKDMQVQLSSYKKSLEDTLAAEYEEKRIESKTHIESRYNYIDDSVDENRQDAVSVVVKVLAGL